MTGSASNHRLASRSPRWALLFFTGLLAFLSLIAPAPAVVPDEGPLEGGQISQAGSKLIFQVRTDRQVALRKLERMPDLDRPRATYLCIEMTRRGSKLVSRLCVGGRKNAHKRIGLTRSNRVNKVYYRDTVVASLKRPRGRKLVVSIDPETARLRPGLYSWRVVYSDGSCEPDRFDCRSSFPAGRLARYRVRPVEIVGCSGGNGEVVRSGPDGRKRIALTFDDGPSTYTPQILHILKANDAKATFFMLGSEVERYPDLARRILALGHEIANHSTHHALLPSASDIRLTSSIIRRVTGFRPCLFRPPYGALSSAVIAGAREAKMKSVIWSVDTTDWKLPGSGSIAGSIGSARSGSIVLMHDGGGPRSQTVEALGPAIRSLQGRGYKLVTTTELLGNRFIYRPR